MTIFKRMLIAAFLAMCIVGCTVEKCTQENSCSSTNAVMSTSFNEEHYIWENWIFPSNKTTGK